MQTDAIAHNIKTDGEVGATFHIEPNHNPKAGEEAQAWFALTRKGGDPLPASACECELQVYDSNGNLILEPEVTAIDAETYEDIPGANMVFPAAGSYELVLTGRPSDGANFEPFQLSYTVNATGDRVSTSTTPATQPPSEPIAPPPQNYAIGWLVPAGIGLAAVIAGAIAIARKKVPLRTTERESDTEVNSKL